MNKTFPISEIFGPTIQGEGLHAGRRTNFIRLAGCDSKCDWCDTKYAWNTTEAALMTEDAIISALSPIPTPLVTLTGGNPLLYDLGNLCEKLLLKFNEVHIETQGTIWADWLLRTSFISVSPKQHHLRVDVLDRIFKVCSGYSQLKVVIFNQRDLEFAKDMNRRYPHIPLILQIGFPSEGIGWLADAAARDESLGGNVSVMPQLHRLFWGDKKGV